MFVLLFTSCLVLVRIPLYHPHLYHHKHNHSIFVVVVVVVVVAVIVAVAVAVDVVVAAVDDDELPSSVFSLFKLRGIGIGENSGSIRRNGWEETDILEGEEDGVTMLPPW